ncbi:MAG TPA: L,D-transpeptidase family protein [Candidatus Paceibacterota bacterium]
MNEEIPIIIEEGDSTNKLRRYAREIVMLVILVFVLGVSTIYLWQNRLDLADTNNTRVQEFYAKIAEANVSFTDAGEMIFPDEQEFLSKKEQYLRDKTSFVEANLRYMKMTLYTDGTAETIVDIITKGKEGSWWETPTGDYEALAKSGTAWSSIGNVWMPYSIQFYGNYFIHGWPYHDDGTLVPAGYSGGCIRLATEDAKVVYDFIEEGMPILVLEDQSSVGLGFIENVDGEIVSPPAVMAKSFLVSDISTGRSLLEKLPSEQTQISSLARLMTAVVAHEIIYLGRSIKVTESMMAGALTAFAPTLGTSYTGLDLLYPLLMQNSPDSANILSGYVGDKRFVRNMNFKANSLGMFDTKFTNPTGDGEENISSATDLAKLLQYIYFKRSFLFDITKGKSFDNVGSIRIGDTVNIANLNNENSFSNDPDLIGAIMGSESLSDTSMLSVWNVNTANSVEPVSIVVLDSHDAKGDTEALLTWVKASYGTSKVGAVNSL